MTESQLPEEFIKFVKSVKGKRSQIVVQHILEHGSITTEDLQQSYGYNHPPRAIADVRDQGVPIETFTVTATDGKTIAAYRFGDPATVIAGHIGGRQRFSKSLKNLLYTEQAGKCAICQQGYDARYLQIDHRVPYRVVGENTDMDDKDTFMLLCRSCNRAKSWSCEHCINGNNHKNPDICKTCYWASPDHYEHIATKQERRIELVWSGAEINDYDKLVQESDKALREYIKGLLRDNLSSDQ